MLKVHMEQTRANNKSTCPPTYEAATASPLTQDPVPEAALNPEMFSDQDSHPTT